MVGDRGTDDGRASHAPPTALDRYRSNAPALLAAFALVLLLGYLIVVPVAAVVIGAFRDGPGAEANFTLGKFAQAFEDGAFGTALRNTLVYGMGSATLAFALGAYLAWLTERTNLRYRGAIYVLVMVPFIVPGILNAIAWVLILNPRIGLANHFAAVLFGADAPLFDSYTLAAMVWAGGTDSITLPFLLMAAAFRTMDPALEEASAVSGADYPHTLRRITLPILAPAMLAAFLLVFVGSVEDFNVPAAMAIPGRIPMFATEVWLAVRGSPADINLASVFAVSYMALAMLGLAAYYYATRIGDQFVTVKGKAFRPTRVDLGRWRFLNTGLAWTVLAGAVLAPFAVMIYTSLLPFYELPHAGTMDRLTVENLQWVVTSSQGRTALTNNLIVGIPSAVAACLLAVAVSWITIRSRVRGRRILDGIAFSPIAIPGMVMGLAFLWVFLTFPILPIYGTLWILGIAFMAKYLPYAVRATHASMSQLDPELEEASQMSGANWMTTMYRIVLPLIAGGLLVGFIYILGLTFKVLALPALLSGPHTGLLATLILDLYSNGQYTLLNAVGVVMFVLLAALFWLSRLVANRFGYISGHEG